MHRIQGLLLMVVVLGAAGCSSNRIPTSPPSYSITGATITGRVLSGQQPVAGAQVYLLAANATGYGNASVSLLDTNATGHADAIGTYVISASDGSFTIPGYYSCTSSQQLYLYALGGNSGLGENSAASEMAVLGSCPPENSSVGPVLMNEVTTVAAAFATAGFATDALHVSSSGTPLALTGIANAFANAFKLASTSTGTALATIPAGTATVPQSTINTLANILNACTQSPSSSSAPCRVPHSCPGGWPDHRVAGGPITGCPVHDGLIVMSGTNTRVGTTP